MVSIIELATFIVDPEECDVRLHQAAFHGDLQLLQELLANEEFLNNIDCKSRPFGTTPLRLAATNGSFDCAKMLIDHGAQVNAIDNKAQTPLFVAIKNFQLSCAELLLDSGADPNGDERNRCTPLYLACESGFLKGVELLLNHGAVTEFPQRLMDGIPGLPLHVTIVYQHLKCFVALLLNGAEPDLQKVKPQLPSFIIAYLSFPHAMVKYDCPKQFAYLFHLFGGNFWQRNIKHELISEIQTDNENSVKYYIVQLMSEPLSLLNLCRISIRRTLGRRKINLLSNLPIPLKLINFLKYSDVISEYS